MATVQILAFITLDGYLARRSTFPDLWEHPEKYGITRIREAALSCLGPDVSFMSLTEWKQGHSGVYLAEAALETLPFTDSLLRFDMADELVLYVLPRFQGKASACSKDAPDFPYGSWPGCGVSTGMSAACITDGSPAGNGCLSIGMSLNVISIL